MVTYMCNPNDNSCTRAPEAFWYPNFSSQKNCEEHGKKFVVNEETFIVKFECRKQKNKLVIHHDYIPDPEKK